MTAPGPPDTTSGRLPGVRYRTETRSRWVEETIAGDTRLVPEEYDVLVPVAPRDWDRTILRAVITATILTTVASIAWTTASIGGLLTTQVHPVIAYGAAAAGFDLLWLCCQGFEWLNRYNPRRGLACAGTWIGLGLAVAAVITHGVRTHEVAAGVVGAGVSLGAKLLWLVLLDQHRVPLSQRKQAWLLARRQDLAAQQAIAAETRRLNSQEAYLRQVYGADVAELVREDPDTSGAVTDHTTRAASTAAPVPPLPTPAPAALPEWELVPAAQSWSEQAPTDAPKAPRAQPADDVATAPAPRPDAVSGVSGHPAPAPEAGPSPASPPAPRTLSGQPEQQQSALVPSQAPVVTPITGQPSIAATVRAALTDDPDISDLALVEHVIKVCGERRGLTDTVARTRRRAEQQRKHAS
ncbi:hypothetical protein ACIP5N_31955 [Streptomyces sp. NPDC088768]|uniref:hypothetical protein n=1 Tax=Streptomyces sp. NPDC088768 TaxID=3365894 RepID=UPI00380E65D1